MLSLCQRIVYDLFPIYLFFAFIHWSTTMDCTLFFGIDAQAESGFVLSNKEILRHILEGTSGALSEPLEEEQDGDLLPNPRSLSGILIFQVFVIGI